MGILAWCVAYRGDRNDDAGEGEGQRETYDEARITPSHVVCKLCQGIAFFAPCVASGSAVWTDCRSNPR